MKNLYENSRVKTPLAIGLFAVIFTGLVLIATYFDLDISKLLTKGTLPQGEYYSQSAFGLYFEAVGSTPMFVMIAVACTIFLWYFARHGKNTFFSKVLPIALGIGVAVAMFLVVKEGFGYILEHTGNKEYGDEFYVLLVEFTFGIVFACTLVFEWKRIKPETNDKLFIWAIVILATCISYLIVHFVKSPVGRMRFRTMNYLGDREFAGFTRWYEVNGKRNVLEYVGANHISDSCKSFPSGHTFSAGIIYTLLCLPYLLDKFNTKSWRITLWAICIGYTGLVAVSRIVVGAHYMSDVLFGGSIAFVMTMLWREIFICKFRHFHFNDDGALAVAAVQEVETPPAVEETPAVVEETPAVVEETPAVVEEAAPQEEEVSEETTDNTAVEA